MDEWTQVSNQDDSARFELHDGSSNPLIFIGYNPSTATPEKLDKTLEKLRGLASRFQSEGTANGFGVIGGLRMFNVYPERSPKPDKLSDPVISELHTENMAHIAKSVDGKELKVVAAWGALIEKYRKPSLIPQLIEILDLAELSNCSWWSLGPLTKNGHPWHPRFRDENAELTPFDLGAYKLVLRRILKERAK
ncbi:DUF1643 domain-containing protein [Leucobacter sp. cx-328]|uniref:DUF1643 domain-containing protein n=1 Tax=unclassified Leucobacter TaxID=2621730 RepID=UPI00165D74D7|nr:MULTISPECIES: DUF1643 domain-containing protein [unclassified Leucobacter]MBC9943225.1 DUF1643 domain-containing protein [Leucobacter sp. cx-328]